MLDRTLRPLVDPPLERLATVALSAGLSANAVTLAGFALGMLALPALAGGAYGVALVFIVLNRIADGLDGAIARRVGPSLAGGFLDIALDFIFYAAVPLGFALARPENGVAAAFLVFAFVGTGSSFLAFAAVAAGRHGRAAASPGKAIAYLGGLTEGSETMLFFLAICLFPGAFVPLAYVFGALCCVTTLFRLVAGWQSLRRP
jgi:phosphatidylglycerophosphate synthase